jgi:hypothetical protein
MNPSSTAQRNPWLQAARKALDTWAPSSEVAVATAIRDAHAGGLRAAAKLLQDRGELALAMDVRKLIEEAEKSEIVTAELRDRERRQSP